MKLSIELYYDTKIKQNHVIENFSSYLNKHNGTSMYLAKKEIIGCKGFESDDDSFSIRVEMTETGIIMINSITYCKITGLYDNEDEDTTTRYYFVTGYRKVSDFIVDLELSLDIANTYAAELNGWSFKNVKMARRMKDRWKLYNQTYYRLYDKCDEGLGNVCTQVDFKEPLHNSTCYLVNRTLKTSDTLKVTYSMNINQICSPDDKTLSWRTTKYTTSIPSQGQLVNGKIRTYYLGTTELNKLMKLHMHLEGQSAFDVICQAFYVVTPSGDSKARLYLGTYENGYFTPLTDIELGTADYNFTLTDIYGNESFMIKVEKQSRSMGTLDLNTSYYWNTLIDSNNYTSYGSTSSETWTTVPKIGSINKYSDDILNIMEIPMIPNSEDTAYFPQIGVVANSDVFSNSYSLDLNPSTSEPRHYTKTINKGVRTRNITMESKLYGSYVRDHMIQYDTFSLPVQPEYYSGYIQSLSTSIYKSVDLSGDLAIKCNSIIPSSYNSNVLTCSRNNNKTLYTSEYLSYLRNGYNYDEKAASLTKIKNGVNTAVSIGSTVVSGAAKGAMGTLGTFGLISSATSAVSTLSNSIISGIENDRALAQKRLELINSAPTMTGSSSGELFKTLNGGTVAPYYVTLKPSDEVLTSIWNLFYFYGYADNTTVDTLQLKKTREYFDYYQGDAESFDGDTTIISKRLCQALSEGITIEHHYNDTWLCEGNLYENWETSI